mgnify:CR=1 FL=1
MGRVINMRKKFYLNFPKHLDYLLLLVFLGVSLVLRYYILRIDLEPSHIDIDILANINSNILSLLFGPFEWSNAPFRAAIFHYL